MGDEELRMSDTLAEHADEVARTLSPNARLLSNETARNMITCPAHLFKGTTRGLSRGSPFLKVI